MIFKKLHKIVQQYINLLERFADRIWFIPLLGFLAALDNFIIIIPNEGILISSSMIIPKRWLIFASSIAIGSTIGALGLVALVELQGLPWILKFYPRIDESQIWVMTYKFFKQYGLLLIFVLGITPLSQQPAIIFASLANSSFSKLAAVIFLGRFIKFLILSYVASHAPRLLKKFWGIQNEIKEAGVELEPEKFGDKNV